MRRTGCCHPYLRPYLLVASCNSPVIEPGGRPARARTRLGTLSPPRTVRRSHTPSPTEGRSRLVFQRTETILKAVALYRSKALAGMLETPFSPSDRSH